MNVTLVGWNCRKNVGDDIMTDVIIGQLIEKYGKCSFLVVGDSKSLPVFKSSGHSEVRGFKNLDFYNSIPIFRTIYNWVYVALHVSMFSDRIIIGGGTIFHSVQLSKYYRHLSRLTKILFNSSCKIDSIGVSVGPFKSDLEEVQFKELESRIDSISVRDERSYILVKNLWSNSNKIQRNPDLALAYNILYPIQEQRSNVIGIVLRQGHVTEQITEFLESFIEEICDRKKDYKFIFYSFCEYSIEDENDYIAICNFLTSSKIDSSKYQIIRYNNNPHTFCIELSKACMIITMRLHGGIMSYALNVPFFMISYHKKCEDFIDELQIDRRYLINLSEKHAANISKICMEIDNPILKNNEHLLRSSLAHFSML